MKIRDGKVWDAVRGRWLVLTPEEWVRQHIILHLTEKLGVQPHRIGREVLLAGGKRADLVVYDRRGEVVMVVECKAQSVTLGGDVLEQVADYNLRLGGVRYLVITNGVELYCMQFNYQLQRYELVKGLPDGL